MKSIALIMSLLWLLSGCSGGSEKKKEIHEQAAGKEESAPQKIEEDFTALPGHALYMQHCLPCHQSDGNGVPGMFPSLHNTKWVNGDASTMIGIVLNGMDEEIEVNGEYFNTAMAPLPQLTNEEIADILTYVRKKYGTKASEVTAAEVKSVRDSDS